MFIRCLGLVALQHDDGGETRLSAAHRHILALLVAAGPDGVSVARLGDEIYGNDITPSWEVAVRKNISRLRPALGRNEIVHRNGRYILKASTQQVDLWTLINIDELDVGTLAESLIQDLLSGEPFAGVEPSPLLVEASEAIAIARLQLVQKMTARHANWSANTLLVARTLAARSYYRADVLRAVLELHLASNDSNASDFATKARRFLVDEMGQLPSADIQSLIDACTTPTVTPVASQATESLSGRVVGMFEPAGDAGMIDRPDLRDAIESRLGGTGVLVTGDSGSGKSALVQSMVPQLAQSGRHVLWLTGRQGSTIAYQPFITAIPTLEQDLAPLLEDGGDQLLRTRCWIAVRRRLTAEFLDLPLVLVVDEAQWLDSHSQALLIFLASTQGPGSPTLFAVGRDDPSARDWPNLASQLVDLGLTSVEIEAFSHAELLELIGLCHQHASSKQRHDFATNLIQRRAALPAVAHELIRAANPFTLSLAGRPVGGDATGVWVERVASPTRDIAAAAAVLGMRFRLAAIAELTGLHIDMIADASDALRDASIWISEQRPDEFSFRHVLIHTDFDRVLDAGDRRRLHLQASQAAEARGDIHAIAKHLVQAGALVDNAHVVNALLNSARLFQAQGSYREGVEAFAYAQSIADQPLDVQDLLSYSATISSSGGDGWDLRVLAFDMAIAANDADLALDVALHGVLRTEDVMGQAGRVKMLEHINTDGLAPARRAQHATAFGRELGLLGLHDRAIEVATNAANDASNPNDRFQAWLGAWASCRALPPHLWPDLPADRSLVTRPDLVSRLAQVEGALALQTGDDRLARQQLQAFADHPATKSSPLRSWHASLVAATLAFVDGQWDTSRRHANTAFTAASDQGIVAAFSTRIAQEFMLQWVAGQHGALLEVFENSAPDVQQSLLAQAACAITLAEHPDQHERAAREIAAIADAATTHQSPLSPAVAVLLASAPAELRSSQTNQTLERILEPFAASAIIPGAAISHLGPASWALAQIAGADDTKLELLRQAAGQAQRWNLRLWSAICWRDIAQLTADDEAGTRARQLVDGTPMEVILHP